MIVINSRWSRFTVPTSHQAQSPALLWDPFSRSYGANLQSSLERVLSRATSCTYTRLPVSVIGTGTHASTLRGFSRHHGISHLSPKKGFPTSVTQTPGAFNHPDRHSLATGHSHSSGQPILMRHPITPRGWDGNINPLSIDYAFQPHLRTRLTLRGRP